MSDPYPSQGLPCLGRERAPGGAHGLCPDCSEAVASVILELPRDFDLLSEAIARRGAPPDGPAPPNKPQSKPPINLLIDALRSQIVYTASAWEEVVRDHQNLSPRRSGAVREGWSLLQSVRILAPRIDVLGALPPTDGYFDGVESGPVRRSGMDGIRRLVALHEVVHRTLGHTPTVIRLPGTCPNGHCRAEAIRREHGSDTVWCDACQGRWTYDDYRRWVRLMTA